MNPKPPFFSSMKLDPAWFLLLSLCVAACAKHVNPYDFEVAPEDSAVSRFPPTEEELAFRQNKIQVAFTLSSKNLGEDAVAIMDRSFKNHLIDYSNVKILNADPVFGSSSDFLAQNGNIPSQPDFLTMLDAKLLSYKTTVDSFEFRSEIDAKVFNFATGNLRGEKKMLFLSKGERETSEALMRFVKLFFPKKAFVLETRGRRVVARISAGKHSGVRKGDRFLIRKRTVEGSVQNAGLLRKISYSETIHAEGEVVLVMEDSSWLYFGKENADVEIGDVAFGAL